MPNALPRSPLALITLVLLASAALGGCVSIGGGPRYKEDRVLTADHQPGRDLSVESANGTVVVRRSLDGRVRVDARLRSDRLERLAEARLVLEGDSRRLSLRVRWPGERRGREGADLTVSLPDARLVTVRTSNDDIVLDRVGERADLRTSNDEIRVTDLPGELIARTSNDEIVVRGAGGPVSATTSNDDIVVVLTPDNPGPVRLDTSNDDIELIVGPGFSGALGAATSSGRVRVRGMGRADGAGGKTAELEFGRPGERSTVNTSNGDVEIEIEG